MSSIKKILYITLRSDFGGGPLHVDMLVSNFLSTFNLYCAAPLEKPYGIKWKVKLGETKFFELPHRTLSVTRFFKLLAFIRKEKIEVVHAHGKGAGVYGRLLKIFKPNIYLIFTFHGLHTFKYSPLVKKIYILIERFFSRFTNLYINVSHGEKKNCLDYKLFKEHRSVVIYNAINRQESNELGKDEIRKLLGLPAEKFLIVSALRFNFPKNYRAMLKIAGRLNYNSDIEFVLLGNGEEKKQAEEIIGLNGITNVRLPGYKENVNEYLLAADIYLSTSLWEGLPYSLIEATRAGLPIVASNITGNNEVVINNYNGYLFNLNDLESAVDLIKNLYNSKSDLSRFGTNSRELFEKNFVLDKMITEMEDIYLKTP